MGRYYDEGNIRRQLENVNMIWGSKHVKQAYECYLEMQDEHRAGIESLVLAICRRYQEMATSGSFGPAAAFELLISTWMKMPEIVKRKIRRIKPSTNGSKPAYEAIRTAIKIKDPPEWFCWSCRRWHTSLVEPDSCPACSADMQDNGPRVAGWHGRRQI